MELSIGSRTLSYTKTGHGAVSILLLSGGLRWSGKSGHKLKLNLCFYGSQKSTKKSSQVRFII